MTLEQRMAYVHDPRLRAYLEQIESATMDAHAVADGLTREQFNWRPNPKRWSVGQCLEHITRTILLYTDGIERMIAESRARKLKGERPFRDRALQRWVIGTMEPPPRMRVRTIRKVEPPPDLDVQQAMRDFDAAFDRFAALVTKSDGVSLNHARMRSPFLRLLQFTLGQNFAINLAHARRHIWQAQQVRRDPRFP